MSRWESVATVQVDIRRAGHVLEIRYRPAVGVRSELRSLLAAEARACPFLTWTLEVEDGVGGLVVVRIEAGVQRPDDIDAIDLFAAIPRPRTRWGAS